MLRAGGLDLRIQELTSIAKLIATVAEALGLLSETPPHKISPGPRQLGRLGTQEAGAGV